MKCLTRITRTVFALVAFLPVLPTVAVGYETGLVIPPGWEDHAMFLNPRASRNALPSHYDWREVAGDLPPIKNQGRCGSCWAFGTVGVLESVIKIRDNTTVSLSEQQLVSCNRSGWGCQGGYFAHDTHLSPGATTTEQFPYLARNAFCRSKLTYDHQIEKWAYVGAKGRRPTVEEIKQAIYEHGPVAATVNATRPFMGYRSGVFSSCTKWGGTNHIVDIVGWDDAGEYWIMRNSWGDTWGEKGYMRIRYNCNNLGKQATFVVYKPKCDPQPIAAPGDDQRIPLGQSVKLGTEGNDAFRYHWTPAEGLENPEIAQPTATPTKDMEYKLRVESKCGAAERNIKISIVR